MSALPADYFERIYEVERTHWWHRGMRAITRAVLAERWTRPGQRLLDAGCGTGGFLRFALDTGSFAAASGIDRSEAAIALARGRVPEAELAVAPLSELPFEASSFDLVTLHDVLQHVHEADVAASLGEVRRVLAPDGALMVRTGGALRARREGGDWRIYDRGSLARTLDAAGFRCKRITYANALPSAWAALRRRGPRAPGEDRHGIPEPASPLVGSLGYRWLLEEARYLGGSSRSLPYGHTLLAVATPAAEKGSGLA